MRQPGFIAFILLSTCLSPGSAPAEQPQTATSEHAATDAAAARPADPKAAKTFAEAESLFAEHRYRFALDDFRKADKQDGGHCVICEMRAYQAADLANDPKAAHEEAIALAANVAKPRDQATAHFLAGHACLQEGVNDHHDKAFEAADSEFRAALQIEPSRADCIFSDGVALSHLKQDGAAKERFEQYLKVAKTDNKDYARAQRFADHPELARERVAPNFQLTALDGSKVTLESLAGKVVLIDFWATWCGPCREALPHVKEIAKRFSGQPLVILSISLDKDEAKWKDFVAHNQMTWMQYRDGSFDGSIATLFGVHAIPATFTIDSDGVLQDQHVGDADIDGKLKKLIARAQESANRKTEAELR